MIRTWSTKRIEWNDVCLNDLNKSSSTIVNVNKLKEDTTNHLNSTCFRTKLDLHLDASVGELV